MTSRQPKEPRPYFLKVLLHSRLPTQLTCGLGLGLGLFDIKVLASEPPGCISTPASLSKRTHRASTPDKQIQTPEAPRLRFVTRWGVHSVTVMSHLTPLQSFEKPFSFPLQQTDPLRAPHPRLQTGPSGSSTLWKSSHIRLSST